MWQRDAARPTGMTLVELLVVVTIIAALVALIFPGVQAVRESGRRVRCSNNVKQLASACLQHAHTHGFYPSGGWGCYWGGDPDCGFGPQQPGGWIYSTLAYTDQHPLWSLGAGQTVAQKKTAAKKVFETPLPLLNCPSRRPPQAYFCTGSFTVHNCDPIPLAAKTDYGASLGGSASGASGLDYYEGPNATYDTRGPIPTPTSNPWASMTYPYDTPQQTWQKARSGVMYLLSRITPDAVIDGAGNTYLLGEKYLPADHYTTSWPTRDNRGMYQGEDLDNSCWSVDSVNNQALQPRQDTAGFNSHYIFGSAHAGSFAMAFCDGSVRWISYDIELGTHNAQGNRRDRTPTSATE